MFSVVFLISESGFAFGSEKQTLAVPSLFDWRNMVHVGNRDDWSVADVVAKTDEVSLRSPERKQYAVWKTKEHFWNQFKFYALSCCIVGKSF